MKSTIFKEDYIGITIHRTELPSCKSSDPPANFQSLDFGTRPQINNLVARNVTITAENLGNLGDLDFRTRPQIKNLVARNVTIAAENLGNLGQ